MSGADTARNVIIIGSGPAGCTAAIYAARADLKPLVFEGAVTAGGALTTTTEVENFPGFPTGIQGPQLMANLRAQAERFGAELIPDDVTEVDLTRDVKRVWTGDEQYGGRTEYAARAVILATGSAYRRLGVPGEDELSGRGVSWCAICDGFFFRDQDIAVIGGGDSAVEEATFLTRFARSVTLVHCHDTLRASKIMQARAYAAPTLRFAWNARPVQVLGAAGKVCGLRLEDTATSLLGVFACGDIVDHTYRQAITAAGAGCSAALDAEHYLAALSGTAGAPAMTSPLRRRPAGARDRTAVAPGHRSRPRLTGRPTAPAAPAHTVRLCGAQLRAQHPTVVARRTSSGRRSTIP